MDVRGKSGVRLLHSPLCHSLDEHGSRMLQWSSSALASCIEAFGRGGKAPNQRNLQEAWISHPGLSVRL